jgi:hypothetical protein
LVLELLVSVLASPVLELASLALGLVLLVLE